MAQVLAKSLSLRAFVPSVDLMTILPSFGVMPSIDSNTLPIARQNSTDSTTSGRSIRGRGGSGRSRSSMLGQTEVFMQSGLKINELPLVVKKVNDVLQLDSVSKAKSGARLDTAAATIYLPKGEVEAQNGVSNKSESETEPSEESREIIAGLRRCFSVGGLFRLLETIPAEEVTPAVAVAALKLIINLDNHPFSTTIPFHRQSLRGNAKLSSIASMMTGSNGERRMSEPFLRYAFINMLLDIIYRSRDPKAIVEGLEIVAKDPFTNTTTHHPNNNTTEVEMEGRDERKFIASHLTNALNIKPNLIYQTQHEPRISFSNPNVTVT